MGLAPVACGLLESLPMACLLCAARFSLFLTCRSYECQLKQWLLLEKFFT